GDGAPPVAEALDDAREGTSRLRSLVEDLLMVSRLEHSQFPVRPEPIELAEFLRIVVAAHQRKANERAVTFSSNVSPGLRIRADTTLLKRVLENIVDNSLRYTPSSGRIRVSAECDNDVRIAVSNSGPPIPKKDREKIFEKFA